MSLKSWEFLKFWNTVYYPAEGLEDHLIKCWRAGESVLPAEENIFKALELTPFDKVKCVILGQDPYHTKGMAHGLAFSVLPHIKNLPPSLRNIFRELQDDIGCVQPRNGDLRTWAERGVLLLNTVLTVEEGKPLSHKNIGWEKLCFEVCKALSKRGGVVFLLMGKQAAEYRGACENAPCIVTPHPSPLSKGFLGSKPFSRVNEELKKLNIEPIDWSL